MNLQKHLKANVNYNLIVTYEDDANDVIAGLIAWSLKNGLRCYYYNDKHSFNDLESWMKIHFINREEIAKSGKLLINSAYEFFADKKLEDTFDQLSIDYELAIANGYQGAMIILDKDCLFNIGFSKDEILRYEERLSDFQKSNQLMTINCYNIDKFGVAALEELTKTSTEFIYKSRQETSFYSKVRTDSPKSKLVFDVLRIREKLIQENKILEFISRLSSDLTFKRDEAEILETALINICQSTHSNFGLAVLLEKGEQGEQVVKYNLPDKILELYKDHSGNGFFDLNRRLFDTQCYILSQNEMKVHDHPYIEVFLKYNVLNSIFIPLKARKEIIGYLWVGSQYKYTNYEDSSELLIKACEAFVKIMADFTEHRKIVQSLIRSSKMNALGELTGGIAHEFNNILMPIIGYSEILKKELKDEKLTSYIDMIQSSALDGEKIVKRIQEFTVAKKREKELIDIDDLITKSVEITKPKWTLEAKLKNKQIQINCRLESKGVVEGISTELREVFINLISNSLDAMPDGGKIDIQTKLDGKNVLILYQDNGVGMSKDVLDRIFEPFFTTKNDRGNGLGLAIVYNIIKNMNGGIEVKSEVSKGALFRITLPNNKRMLQDSSEEEQTATGKKYNILVIDDQQAVAQTVSEMLKVLGHDAVFVMDEKEAYELFTKYAFDCVLCDLALRNKSGMEVAKVLKELNPQIPVLLMTGWTGKFKSDELQAVDRVLSKPFSLKELSRVIQEVMGN